MKVGFALPVSGSWATPDNVLEVADRAESLGYHSLWTFQRLLSDVEGRWGSAYQSVLDPLVTLAYVAAATQRIRLGVAVVNLPFISPTVLAKSAATLDVLSRGRLDLGLGLGWAQEEFTATGATKARLGRRAEQFVAALTALWTQDEVGYESEFYQIPRSSALPKPLQSPHPPILFGGSAASALRRAGRIADGWISSSRAELASLAESVQTVRTGAIEAGRDPDRLRLICRAAVRVRGDLGAPAAEAGPRQPWRGGVEQIKADVEAIGAAGMTEVFIDLNFDPFIGSPTANPDESMALARRVLAALAG